MNSLGDVRPARAGSQTRRGSRRGVALLAAVAVLALMPSAASARDGTGSEFGLGLGAAVCSLVYAPIKVVYAAGGGLVGGFAWLFSAGDGDVARAVVTPAMRGDYVVTPGHLRGEKPLEFIGRAPQPAPTYGAAPASTY